MGSDCVFCGIEQGTMAAAKVLDEQRALAFMDAFPFRPGHVLVILRRHKSLIADLEPLERAELMEMTSRVAGAMRRALPGCSAINWIINDGRAAGQSVPHVHLHLIPRASGDRRRLLWRFARQAAGAGRRRRQDELERSAALIRGCIE